MSARHITFTAAALGLSLAAGSSVALHAQEQKPTTDPGQMQLPADQKAVKAARQVEDPAQRIAALQNFIHDYPDSKSVGRARQLAFDTLLASFPDRQTEIHKQAKALIEASAAGRERLSQQNGVAYSLAEAGSNGVDLKSAEKWAKAATDGDTEAVFTREMTADAVKNKYPVPTPQEAHKYFGQQHAAFVQTLADVYFHEGKYAEATKLLDQAQALDPDQGSAFTSRGQIALAQHNSAEALRQFELAYLHGSLNFKQTETFLKLYREAHGGSDAEFNTEMDARYRAIAPLPFTPDPPTGNPVGHTALLELFTGSGCEPCAAADFAQDAILQSYTRGQVVVLEYDQHVPLPDPLANPDGIARADGFHLAGTPTSYLDGKQLDFSGGDRKDSEAAYKSLTKSLKASLPEVSGIDLKLEASADPAGKITAHATVNVPHPEMVAKTMAKAAAQDKKPTSAATPANATPPQQAQPPTLVVNFALVQNDIRYSGENGVRFHHMVVRALAKPSTIGLPGTSDFHATAQATFDPAAISHALTEYLSDYAKHNSRFGPITFLSTDTSMPITQLSVAAWVEDPATHQVLQASYAPLASAQATLEPR